MSVIRQCYFCKKRNSKDILSRFTFKEDLISDNKKVLNGRGIYFCFNCYSTLNSKEIIKSKLISKLKNFFKNK